ncbi:peptidoglycan-binding protein [Nocardioides sp. WL0053]|uniref:Peptidoglycan-binding protein n=1 Tax=Nocardioides jiangsuensis TaxID=2866161 RepID=A0ABS7RJN6_9ACTN|nr:HlyD family efflux transporter periplasmic adaptor subunit [Nocardioides jiangsuensis]MBY9075241.1 peptidoglycan-binding protein [Nocardioides jiangsuensis]
MRRRSLVVLVVAAVAVSSAATWVAADQVRSPAEAAARTAPPVASPILVPVVDQVLSTRVVTRGTAHFGSPRQLRVTPSYLKVGVQVVTRLPSTGTVVTAGDVLATVSGRPVFVLEGRQPAYRDLGPGMTGQDVGQLERALRRARLSPGAVDGVYDAATGRAVSALYRQHGFEPMVATAAEVARTRPAEADLLPGSQSGDGVQLPADEVVFVPTVPLRITERRVDLGDAPHGPLLTVTDSDVVVDGLVPVEQAGRVRTGAKVLVEEPALGIDTVGRVRRVASRPGTEGADGFHVFFEVAVERPPLALVGASVRLTIPIRTTRSSQLTVPVSAVSMGADGGARVQKSVRGELSFVPVKTGFSADGYVSVTPSQGSLAAGDLVVVGYKADRKAGG